MALTPAALAVLAFSFLVLDADLPVKHIERDEPTITAALVRQH